MAQKTLNYPKGSFALGAGDLVDVYDVNVTWQDGEKNVSTLRLNPGGSTVGSRGCTVTFKSAISEEGFERDYLGKYKKREVVQGRFKLPGTTITVEGRFTSPAVTGNVDNFIDFQIGIIGAGDAS